MKNEKAFHAPLNPLDTDEQTIGCRHTNPAICSKHYMPKVCAFSRADGICLAPPTSWRKQYLKLRQAKQR